MAERKNPLAQAGNTDRERITGIRPLGYTRMGVTIRHLTKLLNDIDARKLPQKVSDSYRRLTL